MAKKVATTKEKTLLVTASELKRQKDYTACGENLRALNSTNENTAIKSIVDFHIDEAEKESSDETTKNHLMRASSLLDSINSSK